MKALSLWQPWASLIAISAKRIETRSWQTSHRGLLAIHATKGGSLRGDWLLLREPFKSCLQAAGVFSPDDLPRGAIVAVARLVDCRFTGPASPLAADPWPRVWVRELSDQERAFGDFSCHRYGWILEDVRPLPEPVPCRGAQVLWTVPPDVRARIDVNGNYEPGNCRWATPSRQARNKRLTQAFTLSGRTQSLADWADEYGADYQLVFYRVQRGWDLERALTEGTDHRRALTFQGRTLTVSEWAAELGVDRSVLDNRVKRGWSDERILSQPVRRSPCPRNGRHA